MCEFCQSPNTCQKSEQCGCRLIDLKTNSKVRRLPIGVMPKFIWDEQRLKELREAIQRYADAGEYIPLDWVKEYNNLLPQT
jgi:hypothetical protein